MTPELLRVENCQYRKNPIPKFGDTSKWIAPELSQWKISEDSNDSFLPPKNAQQSNNAIKRPPRTRFPWECPPCAFIELARFINKSRWILDLVPDWNDEGALIVSKQTWKRASLFLWRHIQEVFDSTGKMLDIPNITPNPDGGIGYYWKTARYELLINIPPTPEDLVGYYGDDKDWANRVKGKTSQSVVDIKLISWFVLAVSDE